ncbi:MAG: NHLP bacteriocin system secretion protein [Phycisphaeraceae bacterium]|nr:NHLP bacteriocin system secretion protein [Phycisphaeraceae bacterium]
MIIGQQTPKSKKEGLFRKASLDRLSSPEQLDLLVNITSPAGWLVLTTLVGLIITAILWGVFGSIPTKVTGSSVLIKTGGVYNVSVPSTGRLTDISVEVGDTIKTGQKVARIAQPDLLNQFEDLKKRSDEIVAKRAQNTIMIAKTTEITRNSINIFKNKAKAQKQLLKEGLITKQSVLSTQQDLENSRNELNRLALQELVLQQEEAQITRNLEIIKNKLIASSNVISPYEGRVLEIKANEGEILSEGSPIFNMERSGNAIKELEVVIFVSAMDGKKVKPGMDVLIAPSTVKREEFGYMVGKITSVSEYPATHQGMMRILQNEELVRQLSSGTTTIQISADLIPMPINISPSGYKWTSGGGPPIKVQSGTISDASITVRSQRPITLVIPILKQFLGI